MTHPHWEWCRWAAIAVLAVLGAVPPAAAHRVTVFAWVEGDTVFTESAFSDGRPVQRGVIEVFDPADTRLLAGTTNEAGAFHFAVPRITDLRIELQAGPGHAAEWTVTAAELRDAQGTAAAATPVAERRDTGGQTVEQAVRPVAKDALRAAGVPAGVTREELEAVVEEVLERKLGPITRLLVRQQQRGPALRDVLGGIGYILGMIGLAAYLRYRRGSRERRR
jgi:nickel transport protein